MFKTVYAVCVKSIIDGGAPGYYAVAMCETEGDARAVKTFVDSCLNTIQTEPWDTQRHQDAIMLINDIVEWEHIKFGYSEGIDGLESYIQPIKIVTAGNGEGFPIELGKLLIEYKQKMGGGVTMEKTCMTCAWGQDGICKKPHRRQNESMAECYVDPTDILPTDHRTWDGVTIPNGIHLTSPTGPVVWEDNESTLQMSC